MSQPPTIVSTPQTPEEEVSPRHHHPDLPLITTQKNIAIAKSYMAIAYSPTENKGAASVAHLCHPPSRSHFWSPSTFPGCATPHDYADSHAHVMESVADLRIVRYDQAWAKDGHVLLRYTAEGSHCGKPYQGIPSEAEKGGTPRKARWSAAAIFEIVDGKVKSFVKDWDQKVMQVCLPLFAPVYPLGHFGDGWW